MSIQNIESLKRRDRETILRWGIDACRTAWEQCDIGGEGPTMQSICSGIPVRSTAPAVRAYRELLRAQGRPTNELSDSFNDGFLETAAADFEEVEAIPSDLIRALETTSHRIDVALASELTSAELDRAIEEINLLSRDPYQSDDGDFPWLDATNLGNWTYALEQEGDVEIAAFFTRSGRTERVRRVFIERRPEQTGGAA
jgi:hypothetical protein